MHTWGNWRYIARWGEKRNIIISENDEFSDERIRSLGTTWNILAREREIRRKTRRKMMQFHNLFVCRWPRVRVPMRSLIFHLCYTRQEFASSLATVRLNDLKGKHMNTCLMLAQLALFVLLRFFLLILLHIQMQIHKKKMLFRCFLLSGCLSHLRVQNNFDYLILSFYLSSSRRFCSLLASPKKVIMSIHSSYSFGE